MKRILIAALVSTVVGGAAYAASASNTAALSNAARPATDTSRDEFRKPAELMDFAGIKPGMTVVDLLPGGGYYTHLFAKAVGPQGKVIAYFGVQYDARLTTAGKDPNNQFTDLKQLYPNLSVQHAPLAQFSTPQPVDLIWTSDNYHDTHNASYATDVAAMNKGIFAALKPGGYFIVVDHRAVKGAGAGATEALHRQDEDIAKREIEAAGFKLVAESNILTNAADDDSKRVFEAGEHDHTDQMVLKFQKPL